MTMTSPQICKTLRSLRGQYVEVERARDNSGTFVYWGDAKSLFVPNTLIIDGQWLYYSANVRNFISNGTAL